MMNLDVINIISFVVGILGIVIGIYFGLEARRLSSKVRKFGWDDIVAGVKFLSSRILKDFQPAVILCSSAGSVGIIVNLFLTYTDKFIPLYMGISKKVDIDFTSEPGYEAFFQTSRWTTYIPDEIFQYKDKKIMILEDIALSGETLSKLVDLLVANGIDRKNILTATLFVTEVAITANRAPDIYWYRLPDTHFYLPWGKSTGKGY